MIIRKHTDDSGVDVHLDPDECDVFVRLALDVEKAAADDVREPAPRSAHGCTYVTLSVLLGKKIRALTPI